MSATIDAKNQGTLWRALDEALAPPADAAGGASRREFLRVMGASLAMAGLAGCGEGAPAGTVARVPAPDSGPPGPSTFLATAVPFDGYAQPAIAEVHDGRPVRLEGNSDHPAGATALSPMCQAEILRLYDPDRSRIATYDGQPVSYDAVQALPAALPADGLRLLTGRVTSPTLMRQIATLRARRPGLRHHASEPTEMPPRAHAIRAATGRDLDLRYALDRAAVVVSLEDDVLGPGPMQVAHARDWAARRSAYRDGAAPQSLLVAESTPTLTGAMTNRRVAAASQRMPAILRELAAALGVGEGPPADALSEAERAFARDAAASLAAHAGAALVAVGAHLPPAAQTLGLRINERLGAFGHTVHFVAPVAAEAESLDALAADMAAGRVRGLIVIESNPVATAPGDLAFRELLARVPLSIHAGLFRDETAAACHWHVPLAHHFEQWTDLRAADGTATICQPLIRPLGGQISTHALLDLLGGVPARDDHAIVGATWLDAFGAAAFVRRWVESLRAGFVAGTAAPSVPVETAGAAPPAEPETAPGEAIEVVFRPDPTIWDGRYANNAWLQELPKPLSKLTWGNAIGISPQRAARLGVGDGDHVEVAVGDRTLVGPALRVPGQAADTVTLWLGYGRVAAGRVGSVLGYDAYPLRTTASPWLRTAARLAAAGGRSPLASTQLHHRIDDPFAVQTVPPGGRVAPPVHPETLYPEAPPGPYAWAMAIDLDACIGCNACVIACQSENNVPVVGRAEVLRGRELHWLRVDRYYAGPAEAPHAYFQPVPCMHCEKAPCELGCPVNATVHGPEGLNQMIYQRCIGTRTCAAYCPYDVRRFNYFDYAESMGVTLASQYNPDVAVRRRGVMEKCTYCVQRISHARIEAKKENRRIRDGEIRTACEVACPTQAIRFGDLQDAESAVARARNDPRHYALLQRLGTRPRTTYLARVLAPDDE